MGRDTLKSGCKIGALLGTAALALTLLPAFKDSTVAVHTGATANVSVGLGLPAADLGDVEPTADAHRLLAWIEQTRDHGSQPFVVVDKRAAEVHVFNANARWVASSPVLLGVALGDDSVPGIGSRPMAMIEAHERTTPAGRFIGERGRNTAGEDVVWVDYDAAVSMHRVRLTQPSERRAYRLSSLSAADNRISYGCINVPVAFYERHIQPVFARQRANVYVLPDVKSLQQVFGAAGLGSTPGEGSGPTAQGDPANFLAAMQLGEMPETSK